MAEDIADVVDTNDGDASQENIDAKAAYIKALAEEAEKDVDDTESAFARNDPQAKLRKQLKEAGELDDSEAAVKEKPASVEKKEETEDEEKSLAAALRNREKIAQQRREWAKEAELAKSEATQKMAELRIMEQRIQAQAQALHKLKTDPAEALRVLGVDPEEFIFGLAQAGTPEAKARAEAKAKQDKLDELVKFKEDLLKQQQEAVAVAQLRQEETHRATVLQEFSSHVAEDKAPYLNALYGDDPTYVVNWGDKVAAQYFEATGKHAPVKEIAEYLEQQAMERYNRKQGKNDASVPKVGQTEQKLKEPKTLSRDSSSERRTLAKTVELDGDERLLAAKVATAAAIKRAESRK